MKSFFKPKTKVELTEQSQEKKLLATVVEGPEVSAVMPINDENSFAAPQALRCANPGRRFAALLVDCIVMSIVMGMLERLFGFIAAAIAKVSELVLPHGISITLLLYGAIVLLLVLEFFLYAAIFESSKLRATPGKLLLGLRVQDSKNQPLSFKRCLFKQFIQTLLFGGAWLLATVISFAIFYFNPRLLTEHDLMYKVGYFVIVFALPAYAYVMPFFSESRQTLFDKLLNRFVVRRS